MEALYFGVTMLSFPLMEEQQAISYRLLQMGVGRIARKDTSPDKISKMVEYLIADDGEPQRMAKIYQERLEFEELRGNNDLEWILNYLSKFGHNHLDPPTHWLSEI